MTKKAVTALFMVMIIFSGGFAASMIIDMGGEDGVQSAVIEKDTAETLEVAVRITGAADLFSYQCKVRFDTTVFTYVGAQLDFGVTGEKNILKKNGGNLIGISQVQINPPASDTVEFSGSITGTDGNASVSGDGLIGVLYLKASVPFGDSSEISVVQGYCAKLGEDLESVDSYTAGSYKVMPIVSVVLFRNVEQNAALTRPVMVPCGGKLVQFSIPGNLFYSSESSLMRIFTLDGRQVALYRINAGESKTMIRPVGSALPGKAGTYLYTIGAKDRQFTATVSVP